MKAALIKAVKQAIVLYVSNQEGKHYSGDHKYNLEYIKNSRIPKHRKHDIERLDDFMRREEGEGADSEGQLAADVYEKLKTIKTGVKLFWLIQVGHSSKLREYIHHAIYIHDPNLFLSCKNGMAAQYKPDHAIAEETDTDSDSEEDNNDYLLRLYLKLKKDYIFLENNFTATKEKLIIAEAKNATLLDNLNKQTAAYEAVKSKLDRLIQGRKDPRIRGSLQMANLAKDMAADANKVTEIIKARSEHLPNNLPNPINVMRLVP